MTGSLGASGFGHFVAQHLVLVVRQMEKAEVHLALHTQGIGSLEVMERCRSLPELCSYLYYLASYLVECRARLWITDHLKLLVIPV